MDPSTEKILGVIALAVNDTVKAANEKKENCFAFFSAANNRTYYFIGSNASDTKDWMEAISSTVKSLASPKQNLLPSPSSVIQNSADRFNSPLLQQRDQESPRIHLPMNPIPSTPPSLQNHFPDATPPKYDSNLLQDSPLSANHIVEELKDKDHGLSNTALHIKMTQRLTMKEDSFKGSLDLLQPIERRESIPMHAQDDFQPLPDPRRPSDASEHSHAPHPREGFISPEDEYDVALCAVEIFLKNPNDRSPEEQAYILAMQQYLDQLQSHITKCSKDGQILMPEYSLASGSVLFLKDVARRTQVEQEYVHDMCEEYIQAIQAQDNIASGGDNVLPLDLEIQVMERAKEIFEKSEDERTPEEQEYVLKLQDYSRQMKLIENQHGLCAQHSLSSAVMVLAKYEEERGYEDVELLYELYSK